jgi:hypothetical protein
MIKRNSEIERWSKAIALFLESKVHFGLQISRQTRSIGLKSLLYSCRAKRSVIPAI